MTSIRPANMGANVLLIESPQRLVKRICQWRQRGDSGVGGYLRRTTRAGDDGGDGGMIEDPALGHLRHHHACGDKQCFIHRLDAGSEMADFSLVAEFPQPLKDLATAEDLSGDAVELGKI